MATPSQTSSAQSRPANQRSIPGDIVFAGDGEPHTPESTVGRLSDLLAQDKLQPDNYSLGGTVQEFEQRMAAELGKEAAVWFPTGIMANILALRKHAGTAARVVLQEESHIYQDEGDALARLCGLNAVHSRRVVHISPLANSKYFSNSR